MSETINANFIPDIPHIVYICADRGIPVRSGRGSSVHMEEVATSLAAAGARVTLLAARMKSSDTIPNVALTQVANDPQAWKISRSIETKHSKELGLEFLDIYRNIELRRQLDRLHRKTPINFVLERMSLFGLAGLQFARHRKIPFFLEVNSPLSKEQSEHRKLKLTNFAKPIEAMLIKEADKIIAVSDEIKNYVRSCDAKHENITVLPNAANKKFFGIPIKANTHPSPFIIGFVGTLKPWHGVSDLLIAFKIVTEKISNARLMIVGDGPERKRLEARARRLDLSGMIDWTGEVRHKEIPGYLSKMDVVTLPYPKLKQFYFSPIKLFEYMASGRAIAASSIGQIKDILEDKKTALLYKPGYVEALANHILAFESNASLRERLGKNARKAVKSRTWENNARTILKMMNKFN